MRVIHPMKRHVRNFEWGGVVTNKFCLVSITSPPLSEIRRKRGKGSRSGIRPSDSISSGSRPSEQQAERGLQCLSLQDRWEWRLRGQGSLFGSSEQSTMAQGSCADDSWQSESSDCRHGEKKCRHSERLLSPLPPPLTLLCCTLTLFSHPHLQSWNFCRVLVTVYQGRPEPRNWEVSNWETGSWARVTRRWMMCTRLGLAVALMCCMLEIKSLKGALNWARAIQYLWCWWPPCEGSPCVRVWCLVSCAELWPVFVCPAMELLSSARHSLKEDKMPGIENPDVQRPGIEKEREGNWCALGLVWLWYWDLLYEKGRGGRRGREKKRDRRISICARLTFKRRLKLKKNFIFILH